MKQYFRQLNDSEIIEQSDYMGDYEGARHVKYSMVGYKVHVYGYPIYRDIKPTKEMILKEKANDVAYEYINSIRYNFDDIKRVALLSKADPLVLQSLKLELVNLQNNKGYPDRNDIKLVHEFISKLIGERLL